MKYIYYFILIFLSILFISCNNKEIYDIVEKYDNGTIKNQKVYSNKLEYDLGLNYYYYSYFPNGVLKEKIEYQNGKIDGTYFGYKDSGELYFAYQYKNDTLHGVSKIFDSNGKIVIETLSVFGKYWEQKEFHYLKDYKSNGYVIFEIIDTIPEVKSFYLIDENNNAINNIGEYYIIHNDKDTINYGEEYEFEIEILSHKKNIYGEIWIGELLRERGIITEKNLTFDNYRKAKYSITDYDLGNNLIGGIIFIYKDTIIDNEKHIQENQYFLYHDFYVKQESSSK
jgi:hypothetical protein